MMDMTKVYHETLESVMKDTGVAGGDWDENVRNDLVTSWMSAEGESLISTWKDMAGLIPLIIL